MRILITGASSLLGKAVLSSFSRASIRAVDLAFSEDGAAAFDGVELLAGDLRNPEFVTSAVQDVTHVLHLSPLVTRFSRETDTLDHATRGTYQLALASAAAGVERIVLASTLDLFADLWMRYRIDEGWRPRPQPEVGQLSAYLAEITLREVTRETGVPALCLRYGRIVDDAVTHHLRDSGEPPDPRWLHVDDARAATVRALEVEATGWQTIHISAPGERAAVPNARSEVEPFSYTPSHTFLGMDDPFPAYGASPAYDAPRPEPIPARPIRRVVILGAGGPLGAAVATELQNDYELRLADIRPVEEAAAAEPQFPGAPLPTPPQPPHTWRVMDMRDPDQVLDACNGMDAIVNCSVLRSDPADAFRVNTLGAYHVMRSAVSLGIKRVVHTGPYLVAQQGPSGYRWDDWIVDDVPARPGTDWVYLPSKYLGKEVCRIFADHYGLEVPALAFVHLRNQDVRVRFPDEPRGWRLYPFSVSWRDAARAVRAGLEVDALPSPFEFFHIGAELPHGVYPMEKAKRVLGWEAKDNFEDLYARR